MNYNNNKTTSEKQRARETGTGEHLHQLPLFLFYLSERQDHEKQPHKARNKAKQEKHQAKPQTSHTGQITSPQGQQRGKR